MVKLNIRVRKAAVKRALIARFIFYIMLLFSITAILYMSNLLLHLSATIVYVPSIVIGMILALTFQYLIYTTSLKKEASIKDFKNTLIHTENLSDFLFPELEYIRKLVESIIDKINPKKFELFISNPPHLNEDNALKIKGDFEKFISKNLEEIVEYYAVIKMKRKGKAIFDDLCKQEPALDKLVPLTDGEIIIRSDEIENRKLLVFDDSIHTGKSADNVLNYLMHAGCEKILFVTVLAQKSSLESLKKKYPKVKFLSYAIEDEKGYGRFYSKYLFGYLDHVNRSLENDHWLLNMKIDKALEKGAFMKSLEEKGTLVYEVERLVPSENEYKFSLESPKLYYKMKTRFSKKVDMDMVKFRFFVKVIPPSKVNLQGATDINMAPVLIPSPIDETFCDMYQKPEGNCPIQSFKEHYKDEVPRNIIDSFCINCLLRDLTSPLIREFEKLLEDTLLENFNAQIVKREITAMPLPWEIYPSMFKNDDF